MGRRALPKLDPLLDLSRHFGELDALPRPWSPADWFGRAAPVEVEIGSGKGLFLRTAAEADPNTHFVGVEIALKYAKYSAAGLARAGLTNALMLVGDGYKLLRECLAEGSVAAVHVYFPDPWWKHRHRKRRVVNAAFLAEVERVLAPGGWFHLWTDVEEYFVESLGLVAGKTKLKGPIEVPERAAEHEFDYRTHFERRMRRHDISIHRARFAK